MKLKAYRMLMSVMYILMILLAVAGAWMGRYILLGVAAALLVIHTVFRYKFWRCPKCGALLAKGGAIHCNECHWEELS